MTTEARRRHSDFVAQNLRALCMAGVQKRVRQTSFPVHHDLGLPKKTKEDATTWISFLRSLSFFAAFFDSSVAAGCAMTRCFNLPIAVY